MILLRPELLALALLGLLAAWWQYRRLRRAQDHARSWGQTPLPNYLVYSKSIALALAIVCIAFALARPVWDPKPLSSKQRGQDTVFLVDVSRSMETRDLQGQSRIEAVRNALRDLIPDLAGDRVAVVAFAGTTVVTCPLTADYGFFKRAVSLLLPGATSQGGTLLGDALRQVKSKFYQSGQPLTIWLFTDGGDHESFPVQASAELAEAGIRLFVWGVGTIEGDVVPERGVSSQLNEALLSEVAGAVPGGEYFGVGHPVWQLTTEYRLRRQTANEINTQIVIYTEGAWYLLWPAGLFFIYAVGAGRALGLGKEERHGKA